MPIPTPLHEPHKIKTVRLLSFPSFEERKKHLAEAKFNVYNLAPSELTFDMFDEALRALRDLSVVVRPCLVQSILEHGLVCRIESLAGQLLQTLPHLNRPNWPQACLRGSFVVPTSVGNCDELGVEGWLKPTLRGHVRSLASAGLHQRLRQGFHHPLESEFP